MTGRQLNADEVVEEVLRDRVFYRTSGGGVTLSGGEPMMQCDFALAILERCKAEGLCTAVETAASCPWDHLARLLPVADLMMVDVKHIDPEVHREATGVSNERILANARRLARTGKPLIFRVPVVPTVNDTPGQMAAIANFVHNLGGGRTAEGRPVADPISMELLPFHRLASDKYRSLDMDYRASHLEPPTRACMAELVEAASACGIAVRCR
jgi:pyruvate formate lyase activating enzyme